MERPCRGCGEPITPGPREKPAHPKQWCSPRCRAKYQRLRGNHADSYVPKSSISYANCSECGDLFVLHQRGRLPEAPACRKPECQAARTKRRAAAWHERYKAANGRSAGGRKKMHEHTCARPGCGKPFRAPAGRRYCSYSCATQVTQKPATVAASKVNRKYSQDLVLYTGPPTPPPTVTWVRTTNRLTSGQCRIYRTWFVSFHTDITCSPVRFPRDRRGISYKG